MKAKKEEFELKYVYDDIEYTKYCYTWTYLHYYLIELKKYDSDLKYTITKIK